VLHPPSQLTSLLESLSSPAAKYLVGWSHGKETLKSGQYDTLKGSYYINCAFYQDPTLAATPAPAAAGAPAFPEYTAANIWPPERLLPGFRAAVEDLCRLIIDTAILVARVCDRYAAARIPGYAPGYLEHVVRTSMTTKARLLHYFPPERADAPLARSQSPASAPDARDGTRNNDDDDDEDDDDWCATHIDHGCLTGLTSALFVNETAPLPAASACAPLPALATYAASPDPAAGLYIRSRAGAATRVAIPPDCLAFQTGEALQLITRGRFRAVPHYVRGPRAERGVARNTLAVFTQPNLEAVVDPERGLTFAEFAREVVARHAG
jgi:hypothetical protein